MSKENIVEYLNQHQTDYTGKYRRHSHVVTGVDEYKFRYYILDAQFREISVFVTINLTASITYEFSVDLHQQEQVYILKDALQTILYFMQYKTVLDIHFFDDYIQLREAGMSLEPLDYRILLDYLEYHQGTTQDTIDTFYSFYFPYIEKLYQDNQYRKLVDSFNLLLDKVLYEYEWDGETTKYLDTQYQYHLYYFRKIIVMIHTRWEDFYTYSKYEIIEILCRLCELPRFAFAIMSDLKIVFTLILNATEEVLGYIKERVGSNIVMEYLESIYTLNTIAYRNANLNIIRFVMQDMLTFVNHDLQVALGNAIVAKEGYDILIQLFARDYNTFVFACFPIDSFPQKYRKTIRDELEKAIMFYAGRMEHDEYRLSSFEQVFNINRLLMENYKEYC